jgi:hypothetical protein
MLTVDASEEVRLSAGARLWTRADAQQMRSVLEH